jgi:hypothetical protein
VVARNEGKLLVITFSNKETSLDIVKLELEEFAKKQQDNQLKKFIPKKR